MLFLAVFFYPSNELDFTVSGIDAISRVPILRFFGHLPNDMFPFFTFWVHTKHLKYRIFGNFSSPKEISD